MINTLTIIPKKYDIQTLEFNNGVAKMFLETLDRTARYNEAKGFTNQRPIHHTNFIRGLMKLCAKYQIAHSLSPIYASQRQALIVNYNGDIDLCPVENFLIQRLVTQINLIHPDDKGQNIAIGIGYNERGISVTFGTDIWVCSNQSIFGDNLIRTYGRDKTSFPDLLLNVEQWLSNYHKLRTDNYQIIQRMNETTVTSREIQNVIGELFYLAVSENLGEKVTAPLNQTQVADLVRASYLRTYQLPENQNPTVWDINQWGTHYLKPERTDLLSLQETNHRFNNYLLDNYC